MNYEHLIFPMNIVDLSLNGIYKLKQTIADLNARNKLNNSAV